MACSCCGEGGEGFVSFDVSYLIGRGDLFCFVLFCVLCLFGSVVGGVVACVFCSVRGVCFVGACRGCIEIPIGYLHTYLHTYMTVLERGG